MTLLYATEVGRRVALSGLLPQTAHFLLSYVAENREFLVSCLPDEAGDNGNQSELDFCLLSAALMSPEFSGLDRTRFIHFGFDATVRNIWVDRLGARLAGRPWQAYRSAVNAASLIMDWISGAPFSALEGKFEQVRAGTVEGLSREVVWCLSGLADIVAAATKSDCESVERPACLRSATANALNDIRRMLPAIRQLAARLNSGLPPTVLWMMEEKGGNGRPIVTRREAMALAKKGLGSYHDMRMRNNWDNLIEALRDAGVNDAHLRAKRIKELADSWHMALRERHQRRQLQRIGKAGAPTIRAFYDLRESAFEKALERLLDFVNVRYERFDISGRAGAFDYLLLIQGRPPFPLECKSKQGNSLVPLNEATDILRATEIHGYPGALCATLCQPGIDPNVPAHLVGCARLCVVESHDFAEVALQIALGRASEQDLYDWLSQPGQAQLDSFWTLRQATRLGLSGETG